ncbi:serine-rich adhesin for platelets-like [Pecten maximus]|uniref:serine-rich adhesin for platelets-like n=1 Tax=Pecten maximus TaxID=6579 RepID=UPI0014590146|nr:serine-rich adhesin for platelets-like [Pecten maximus]
MTSTEPCLSYENFTADSTRSPSHIEPVQDNKICDAVLSTKWYRLVGDAGSDLTNDSSVLVSNGCGTSYQRWMNGSVPDVSEGIVNREICMRSVFAVCHSSFTVQVKNCCSFRVYHLRSATSCPQAYCVSPSLVPSVSCSVTSWDTTTTSSSSTTRTITSTSTSTSTSTTTSTSTSTSTSTTQTTKMITDMSTTTVPQDTDEKHVTIVTTNASKVIITVIVLLVVIAMTLIGLENDVLVTAAYGLQETNYQLITCKQEQAVIKMNIRKNLFEYSSKIVLENSGEFSENILLLAKVSRLSMNQAVANVTNHVNVNPRASTQREDALSYFFWPEEQVVLVANVMLKYFLHCIMSYVPSLTTSVNTLCVGSHVSAFVIF